MVVAQCDAAALGKTAQADAVNRVVNEILARPEHQWFEKQKKAEPIEPSPTFSPGRSLAL